MLNQDSEFLSFVGSSYLRASGKLTVADIGSSTYVVKKSGIKLNCGSKSCATITLFCLSRPFHTSDNSIEQTGRILLP